MKKECVKILSVVLISVMFLSLIAGIADAQDTPTNQLGKKIQEIITNALGGKTSYDYVSNILSPQILLSILIFLIIFAIIGRISLFADKKWLSVLVSVIVGILASAFIDPRWFGPILNQYTAIGITISFLLPFVLLFYFIKEIAPHNKIIQHIVWATFLVIVIINIFMNWSSTTSRFSKGLYVIILLLGLVMLVMGHWIFKYIFKEQMEEALDKWDEIQKLIAQGKKSDANAALSTIGSQLPPGRRKQLADQINQLP